MKSIALALSVFVFSSVGQAREIGVLGDVEGQWARWEQFAKTSPVFTSTAKGFELNPGSGFVFQGDAIDRGDHGRAILQTFLDLKTKHPADVALILGNRDINKLRLLVELEPTSLAAADPSYEKWLSENSLPSALRTDAITKLKFILAKRMGAGQAFEFRRTELQRSGLASSDQAVLDSMLNDLKFDGLQGRYLRSAQIAHIDEKTGTLFVHGAVTETNFGLVPGSNGRITDVRKWVEALNSWARAEIEAATKEGLVPRSRASELINFQRPAANSDQNPLSVVSARYTDEMGLPKVPSEKFLTSLEKQGIRRVSVGHSPYGEVPIVLRQGGFEIVLADVSYNKLGRNFPVVITEKGATAESTVQPHGQVKIPMVSDKGVGGRLETGEIVVGELANGKVLTFKSEKFTSIHSEITPSEAKSRIGIARCQALMLGAL